MQAWRGSSMELDVLFRLLMAPASALPTPPACSRAKPHHLHPRSVRLIFRVAPSSAAGAAVARDAERRRAAAAGHGAPALPPPNVCNPGRVHQRCVGRRGAAADRRGGEWRGRQGGWAGQSKERRVCRAGGLLARVGWQRSRPATEAAHSTPLLHTPPPRRCGAASRCCPLATAPRCAASTRWPCTSRAAGSGGWSSCAAATQRGWWKSRPTTRTSSERLRTAYACRR